MADDVTSDFSAAVNMTAGQLESRPGTAWRYSLMNLGHDPLAQEK